MSLVSAIPVLEVPVEVLVRSVKLCYFWVCRAVCKVKRNGILCFEVFEVKTGKERGRREGEREKGMEKRLCGLTNLVS